MKLRTVDSPGVVKLKSKFYYVIRTAILCLFVLCAVVGMVVKNRISPPYKKVFDDLCIAIQRADGTYMKEHIPDIQGEDKTEKDKAELDNYIWSIVSQISGEYGQEDNDIPDMLLASRDSLEGKDNTANGIQNVSYKIMEKHKMKSWDVAQEEEETTETANKLQDYIDSGFLGENPMEEIKSSFSDYAYQYGHAFFGVQKQYKIFDKEQVYMLLVEFSFTQEEGVSTHQTIVYVAKADKRWVLLAVENIEDYENIVFQEDSL